MASEIKERNALAELAHVLSWFVGESQDGDSVTSMQLQEAINKSHRIIEELAKVPFVYNIYGAQIAIERDSAMAVERCRAIAEE